MKDNETLGPKEIRDDPNLRDENPKIVPVQSPRITIVDKVYHQVPGEASKSPPPSRFYRWLESDEEAYSRTLKVGTGWQPIDLGWLKDKESSLLILGNATKRLPSRKPTVDEEQEFYSRILEVGIAVDGTDNVISIAYLPVGEDMRLPPLNLHLYRIRCRTTETKYSIFVCPI